jgi:hypothetical protein
VHVGGRGRSAFRAVLHHVPITGRHPLTRAVVRALGPRAAAHRAFLGLLDRRLAALERLAAGESVARAELGTGAADRRTARRFLRPREATWHDGDENRVRAHLELAARRSESAAPGLSRALLAAAEDAAQSARAETLWFLLWAMESALADLAAEVAGND